MTPCFVGIDIAAQTATVVWQTVPGDFSPPLIIDQSETGFRQLATALRVVATPADTWVVMEASGSYWMGLAAYPDRAGFRVSVVNPLQAHYFAQARLQRSKTDALDARMLSELGRVLQPRRWTPPPSICEQLEQRLSERQQLVDTHTAWRNQLHALRQRPDADAQIVERWQQRLAALKAEIETLTAAIERLLLSQHEWLDSARRLLRVQGIGILPAAWLLVATHHFAYCQTPEQAVAFAGLAPHPRDSGSSVRGKRQTGHSGHATLRWMLYLAAGSALQHNPPLRAFYLRLVGRGKLKNVARVAVARKLLVLAWTLVVKQRDFDPNFALAA